MSGSPVHTFAVNVNSIRPPYQLYRSNGVILVTLWYARNAASFWISISSPGT